MSQSMFIKTGVIGHPIAHSKSPLIHGYWREVFGLLGSYEAVDIHPDHLEAGVQDLIEQGFAGFNVTVPHKVSIMALCEELDEGAAAIGAVNTVEIRAGKLYGRNTDAYGFAQNIKENAPENWHFEDGKALVLGAGGASKAVVYALLKNGVTDISLTNRTYKKAQDLCVLDPARVHAYPWEERDTLCHDANIIVNTTALGMQGQLALEIDLSCAPATCLVSDIVYAPLMSDLLVQAKARDLNFVTGIGMLLHQARPGFELWNGVLPDVTQDLERAVLHA